MEENEAILTQENNPLRQVKTVHVTHHRNEFDLTVMFSWETSQVVRR